MDLKNGGRIPSANVVMLSVRTLISPLKASMITRTIIGQVLHRRVDLEPLLMEVWCSVRLVVENLILLRMLSLTPPSSIELMHATGEQLDNQQASPNVEAHVLVPERESSQVTAERAVATSNLDADSEAILKCITDKWKQKVEEKTKEPVFIRSVELADLDDCNVPDRNLQCDNTDSDDDEGPNAGGIGIHDGSGSCSQTMEAYDKSAFMSVAQEIGEHSKPLTTTTVVVKDPLFNAAGKAPPPDVVIVKQEASWFQLQVEKRQRKTAEKLAVQQEKETCEGS